MKKESGTRILGRWRVPFFYGWVIVCVVFAAEFAASGLGGSTVTLFFKPMQDTFGWSLSQMVGATTANALAGILIAPFLGALIDRFGVKPIMLWGTVAGGVGMLLMTGIREVWQFWVLYAGISALGLQELGGLPSTVAVTKWFVRRRGRAMAFATLGQTVGTVVLAPAISLLIAVFGWQHTWTIMGVAVLVVMVPVLLTFMRNRPEEMGLKPDGEGSTCGMGSTNTATAGVAEINWTVREAMRTRSLWLLVLTIDLSQLAFNAVHINLVPFLVQQEGMPISRAGWILSGFMAAATFARLFWGFVMERVAIRYCLAVTCVARAFGSLSLVFVPYPWNIASYLSLTGGLGSSFGVLQPMAFASYFGRNSFGSLQGVLRPFLAIPQLVGPLFTAYLFDRTGTFNLAFILSGCLAFAAVAVAPFATPPARRYLNAASLSRG